MQNRRMFLGSAAAAGVGAAVGGAFLFPASNTHAQGHATTDPLLAELQAQLLATITAVRKGQGKMGEHARSLARHVRLLNAHGAGAAADAELRGQLRDLGRDAILAREMDLAKLAVEMKAVGVERVPLLTATYAGRMRVLDATVKNGMSATLAALGDAVERIAPALDRQPLTAVASRQDEGCWEWLLYLTNVEAVMWLWCVLDLGTCYLLVWYFIAWATFLCSLGCICVL
jgi:hypothetical protein